VGVAATDLTRRLEALLEPEAERNGFELVAVEQAGGRHTPIIRVLLDRPEGINLDAICAANRWVGDAIDADDPLGRPYTLEVSSPGVDRPLRRLSDFERFAGEEATVKARVASGSRSTWTGTIGGVDGTDVLLDVDGEHIRIAYDDVLKARLKGAVSFNTERSAD